MKSLFARGIVPSCILSAATVAVLVVPSAASAKGNPNCKGSDIVGQGSSLQVGAQGIWDPDFNSATATKSKFVCPGAEPTVKYTKSSSGAGLESWGAEDGTPKGSGAIGFGIGNAFFGTDEPPNATQLTNIEKSEKTPTPETVESIPVAQESVALIVNLPAGCTANSEAAPGRLVLSDADLAKIWDGEYKTWSKLTDSKDEVKGTGCSTDAIKPVVREDQSGTTHIFKRFLFQTDNADFATADGTQNWSQLSEGSLNIVWPTATDVIPSGGEGGGQLIKKVTETEGGIGYVNLFEARAKGFAPTTGVTAGPGTGRFWVKLQNSEKASSKGAKITYVDPSTGEEDTTITAQSANCGKTVYTDNEDKPFPPESTLVPWDTATTLTTEKTYALCGLTYDVALQSYSSISTGTTSQEAETVKSFLQFVTDKKGGQSLLEGHDYYPLPKGAVATEAADGAAEIGF
jgi:ABC-type phosphate transport system substrate-binding protein